MPVVGKHDEIISRDLAVARVGRDHIDFAIGDGLVHEFRLHLPLRPKVQTVGVTQRQPFRACEDFIVAGNGEPSGMTGEITDRVDIQRFGFFACHRQCVGVLETEGSEHFNTGCCPQPP